MDIKILRLVWFVIAIQLASCQAQKTTVETNKIERKIEKKESKYAEGEMINGTYFIQSVKDNFVLEPYQKQYGSLNDLNLVKLDNSAIQKWLLKENINPKTKKTNGTFSIYLFVDQSIAIANKYNNPRIGKIKEYPKDSFVVEYNEAQKAYIIKSNTAKGDCIGKKEGRFAKYVSNDGSQEIFWKFLKTE